MRISQLMMAEKAVAQIPRPPQMRNFIASTLKRHMVIAFVFSCATTSAYYFAVFKPRKEAYRNFYASYDPDKAYAEMKKTGVFQSTAVIEGEKDED